MKAGRWVLPIVATTIVCAAAYAYYIVTVRPRMKAKTTVTRMRAIAITISAAAPPFDRGQLETQLAAEGDSGLLLDGWGNRLAISIENRGETISYSVRSLGRDGVQGTCCQRVSGSDWDTDAVFENGEWRQVWQVP